MDYLKLFRHIEGKALEESDPIELARLIGQLEGITSCAPLGLWEQDYGFALDHIKDLLEVLDRLELDQVIKISDRVLDRQEKNQPKPTRLHYRQEYANCGKERCKKCASGPGHGPYWYSYRFANGSTYKRYVGKELPASMRPGVDEVRYMQKDLT